MAQQKAVEAPEPELEDLVDELEPGTKLLKGQYTITRYLNSGGFGITYLARDSLDRDVVIKECFPAAFCRRSQSLVAARSRAHTAELRSVVQLFVKEARNLAKIVHPNIVAVHQVFEDNGTAYMAIDFIDGFDVQQIIDGLGATPSPAQIVAITEKLLAAVGFIHDHDMLHRDISPDNVLIDKKGEPILIDFGAAREQASQKSRAMSALRVVKDGYSPQEFYIAGSEQGPWSDLYALGATLYHLISGEAPMNGQARLAALADDRPDPYLPLAGRFADYPPGFLEAIDRALNTLPKQRVQSAKEWLVMFRRAAPPPQRDATAEAVRQTVVGFTQDQAEPAVPGPAAASVAPPPPARPVSTPAPLSPPPQARSGRNPAQVVAGVSVALVVILGAYVLLGQGDAPAPAVVATAATASAAPVPAAAAPAPAAAAPAEVPAPAETAPPAVAETVASAPAAPAPAEADLSADDAVALAAEASLAAPPGTPAEAQIAFSVWDVQMPFDSTSRIVGDEKVTVISRLDGRSDLQLAGDWLAPGLRLYAVNGVPVAEGKDFTAAVLDALHVDPDGRARVVVDYAAPGAASRTGLLTVPTVRLVTLANGVGLAISHQDEGWKTVVTSVADPAATDLVPGDVLFREKQTQALFDQPDAVDMVLKTLVGKGETLAQLSVVRQNQVVGGAMRLALAE
ncbi:serine/threonine-protein kinase [Tabrizicola sp.]|uniref:serine/threonine-protein kinase n=1 Tax=Tabrizicola sp. TaxID=2005166 RepID=UPI0035B4346E